VVATITTLSQASNPKPASPGRPAPIVEIGAEHDGRRIDNFLLAWLKPAPKSLIYKIVRDGQVRVNSRRVKPDYRLAAGDRLRLPPLATPSAATPAIARSATTRVAAAIVFENEHLLIVDKPAGLACHGGTGLRYGVVEIARSLKPDAARVDLAHRIDRDTSGCLLLSKDVTTLREVHATLRAGDLDKRYLALMRGRLPRTLTSIDCALQIERSAHGERRSRGRSEGKPALTHVVAHSACGPHTLAEFQLVTGRMHQIRAHAQHIGHPLAGDLMYGEAEFNRDMRACGLRRLFLHASRLAFRCRGRVIDVELPLPPELQAVVQRLRATP